MAAIVVEDAVNHRADDLARCHLNGLQLALVTLEPSGAPTEARLQIFFHNTLHVAEILAEIQAAPAATSTIFRVRGGHRIPGGDAARQVKVTAVAADTPSSLALTIAPIGDYSTYRLEIVYPVDRIDPFFSMLPFKFRPGCFTNDCAPSWDRGRPRASVPVIDYLAKDYDSFRHALVAAMMQRVPGWRSTSEADLDQVLIDLLAATADELSDYQDRVLNEAYLASARKRVSLARHARLMDYHVHQGNQASTWLAVLVDSAQTLFTLSDDLVVWSGGLPRRADAVVFATREKRLPENRKQHLDPLLNTLTLHTWSDAQPALAAGSTSADVMPTVPGAGQTEATRLRNLIVEGTVSRLLVQEHLNPATGRPPGRDPRKRQLLRLLPGTDGATLIEDPVTGVWMIRVHWQEADQLQFDYSFTTFCPGKVERVSLFHANLLRVHQGVPVEAHFHEPGSDLPLEVEDLDRLDYESHREFERVARYGNAKGVLCALPFAPLAYLPTPPGGEVPPRSTLHVEVEQPGGGSDQWKEVISLVHSDDSDEEGDHFAVETDEQGRSWLRLGDGVNGQLLPPGAVVHCEYQVGGGHAGNVGADQLTSFRPLPAPLAAAIPQAGDGETPTVWNPFDIVDGADPEPVESIVRAAPEAYRARQLRAVTLADYEWRAQEVLGVSRAVARYAWTGSWRIVQIVIDPQGMTQLSSDLATRVSEHLEAVRLIGEDLEIRHPRYVPLAIEIALCLDSDYWPEDLRYVLEQEFSDGYTPDGRRGFFHPDAWTFGQAVHRSEIEGRLHAVPGVEHILSLAVTRFQSATPGAPGADRLEVRFDEIVQVRNDPDHLERGYVRFALSGGRQ